MFGDVRDQRRQVAIEKTILPGTKKTCQRVLNFALNPRKRELLPSREDLSGRGRPFGWGLGDERPQPSRVAPHSFSGGSSGTTWQTASGH